MAEALKILIAGMPRSMTTWAFNVLRELLGERGAQYLWIAPGSPEESAFGDAQGTVLAKCHHFSPALVEAADLVVYSYRDIRTAAVSYRRRFGSECTREQLDNWVDAERRWLPFADAVLRYEDVQAAPLAGIATLRSMLADKLGADALAASSDAEVASRVEITFREVENAPTVAYDASTMILPAHRTFQPPSAELPDAERQLYERVGAQFGDWLAGHGYGATADLGQELEYRIAETLLGAMSSPCVVDVGVERGSFTEAALRAGARRVVGFEPLPRHLEYLAQRFAANPAVEVHPLAISRRSGTAVLHVATDAAGHELDYHHTLSDLADTATVIRSRRTLDVRTATLADLVAEGILPAEIDLLKVDTDGHDLAVLEGLGAIRPRAIMAEYWDTLPESSGTSEYALADLVDWAKRSGYPDALVVRRHGRIELVQHDQPWTLPGDWGNVIFLRADFPVEKVRSQLQSLSRGCYDALCDYVGALMRDVESKEAEIRRLHAAASERDAVLQEQHRLLTELRTASALLEPLRAANTALQEQLAQLGAAKAAAAEQAGSARAIAADLPVGQQAMLMKMLDDKEAVIREMTIALRERTAALHAYRGAFVLFSFILIPLNFVGARVRRLGLRAIELLRPRLGVLNQHRPRELQLPETGSQAATPSAGFPRITIVTPSFNQAQFIERTIRSVLAQGYPDLEYRVQDGGSRDGTVEILRRYEDRMSGWDSRADTGQSQAINRAFEGTTGEIMAWLNSDDVLFPGSLAYVADYFARHPDVDVVYGHRILIDEQDRQIGRWILPSHSDKVLSWADFVPQETLFWRRRIWEKAGGRVDESFRFAMDWDLLLRFREAGARFARVPRFLGGFRIHGSQKTSASISDVGHKEMDLLRQRVLGRVPSQAEISRAVMPYLLRHVAIDVPWKLRDGLAEGKA